MIKKVNSTYQNALTIEDVMTTVSFLQRYKFPFVIVTGLSLGIWIARVSLI